MIYFISKGEANKQLGDYKFKLQKAEQDVSTLQANVSEEIDCVYVVIRSTYFFHN
jgi:hypothetical protein